MNINLDYSTSYPVEVLDFAKVMGVNVLRGKFKNIDGIVLGAIKGNEKKIIVNSELDRKSQRYIIMFLLGVLNNEEFSGEEYIKKMGIKTKFDNHGEEFVLANLVDYDQVKTLMNLYGNKNICVDEISRSFFIPKVIAKKVIERYFDIYEDKDNNRWFT